MIDDALGYARRGLAVFPVWPAITTDTGRVICGCGRLCDSPAKHPIQTLARHGLKDASTDEDKVRWFWICRHDANIAMATGTVTVLDIDPRHGGDVSLAKLEAEHGPLPATWRSITGGGGAHLFFNGEPVANSAGSIAPGIDVRGNGGYVVLPPSLHISGTPYTWAPGCSPDAVELATMPQWLLALVGQQARHKAVPVAEWRQRVHRKVPEGERNKSVAEIAGLLLRRHIDLDVTMELMQAWNLPHCEPPLHPDEVATVVNSINNKEHTRRRKREIVLVGNQSWLEAS
jgi:hypothetical protein